jgi:hypothetical protein
VFIQNEILLIKDKEVKVKLFDFTIEQEHKSQFEYLLNQENVRILLIGALLSTIAHIFYLWIGITRFQNGHFDENPTYRWIFYTNLLWWLPFGIPIRLFTNRARIYEGSYPLRKIKWRINFSIIWFMLSSFVKIYFEIQNDFSKSFFSYLIIILVIAFFNLMPLKRATLLFICFMFMEIVISINVKSFKHGQLIPHVYALIAPMYIYFFSNAGFKRIYRQFVAEKKLEIQNKQLEIKRHTIEHQKIMLSEEFEQAKLQLTSTALLIAKKNSFLLWLKNALKELQITDSDAKNNHAKLIWKIDNELNKRDEWGIFQTHFEKVEPNFIKNLVEAFPNLSQNDLRLVTFIKLNLSLKEIGDILNVTSQSIVKARYRLKKRLNLGEDETLEQFLTQFK